MQNRMGLLQAQPRDQRPCHQVTAALAPRLLRRALEQPGPVAITDRMLTEPPRQDPRLFELVRVEALRPFCVAGRRIDIGEVVSVERHVALSLQAIKKAVLI